jgi:hypothetical protein
LLTLKIFKLLRNNFIVENTLAYKKAEWVMKRTNRLAHVSLVSICILG